MIRETPDSSGYQTEHSSGPCRTQREKNTAKNNPVLCITIVENLALLPLCCGWHAVLQTMTPRRWRADSTSGAIARQFHPTSTRASQKRAVENGQSHAKTAVAG